MKKLSIGLAIVVAVIAILGIIAPKEMHIEKEIVINKPKDQIYNYLKVLRNGEKWEPWGEKDANIKREYRGAEGTVGSVVSWAGNKDVGVGEQEITGLLDNRIDLVMRFKQPIESVDTGYYIFEPVSPAQTKVKWGMTGHSKFPFNIFCFVFNMKGTVEKEFEKGLANLKSILESQ